MKLIHLVVTIATVVCQSPDLCPLSCTCSGKSVICKGVNVMPNGLPVDLEELVFDVSLFSNIQQDAFKVFTHLKTLRFINSNFTYIHSCSISNLKNLSKIEFSNIKIQEIASNGFSHISSVKEIIMEKILIQKIREYAFNDFTNVDSFKMDNVVVADMQNFVIHGWSNIRLIQLNSMTVLTMKPQIFQDMISVDRLEIIGGAFRSSMCGMKTILAIDSVKKIKLVRNQVICSCDSTWLFENNRNSKDFEVINNTCVGSGEDVTKLDEKRLCTNTVKSECSNVSSVSKNKVQDCRTYTLDEPIMPQEAVPFPKTRGSQENGATGMKLSSLFIFSIAIFASSW